MTKSIATASINRETAVALIDAAIAAARAIGIPAAVAVVDATDGSVLVEASGSEPLLSDASGCTIATTTTSGYDLSSPAGVSRFETGDTALSLALDGAAVAVERDGRLALAGSDPDASTDPIDLGPSGRTVHFTQA